MLPCDGKMRTPAYNSPFAHVSIEPHIQNHNMLHSNYLSTGIYPVVSTLCSPTMQRQAD